MGDVTQLRARGITVIMIEHVMQAIMGISDRIIVLDYGRRSPKARRRKWLPTRR